MAPSSNVSCQEDRVDETVCDNLKMKAIRLQRLIVWWDTSGEVKACMTLSTWVAVS